MLQNRANLIDTHVKKTRIYLAFCPQNRNFVAVKVINSSFMLTKGLTLCEKERIRDINENKIKMFLIAKTIK